MEFLDNILVVATKRKLYIFLRGEENLLANKQFFALFSNMFCLTFLKRKNGRNKNLVQRKLPVFDNKWNRFSFIGTTGFVSDVETSGAVLYGMVLRKEEGGDYFVLAVLNNEHGLSFREKAKLCLQRRTQLQLPSQNRVSFLAGRQFSSAEEWGGGG